PHQIIPHHPQKNTPKNTIKRATPLMVFFHISLFHNILHTKKSPQQTKGTVLLVCFGQCLPNYSLQPLIAITQIHK
ncbi:MAG: hypothetical protein SO255_01315, partial [Sodaliphilus sp.]|nr:hypothetical protein [Sodaliphilus sp.]